MYKSQIAVRFQLDGIHNWADCPIEEVSFLRDPHHHTFFFELRKTVTHDDRDIELIKFKRDVIDYLTEKYHKKSARCLVFGGMSCEMIARDVLQRFGCDIVEVWEDNIVGGVSVKEKIDWPPVVIICGQTASGKGLFVQNEFPEYRKISVSAIVRELAQTDELSELNKTHSLDQVVINKILPRLLFDNSPIVIEGVRQLSILDAITREMTSRNHHNQFNVVWLDVPKEIREERFIGRKRQGDNKSLTEVDQMNDELGLKLIKDAIDRGVKNRDRNYKIIKHY